MGGELERRARALRFGLKPAQNRLGCHLCNTQRTASGWKYQTIATSETSMSRISNSPKVNEAR